MLGYALERILDRPLMILSLNELWFLVNTEAIVDTRRHDFKYFMIGEELTFTVLLTLSVYSII